MTNANGIRTSGTRAERVLVPRLVAGARCKLLTDNRLRFEGPGASSTLPPLPEALTDVFTRLEGNTTSIEEFADVLSMEEHHGLTAMLFMHLARFSAQGLLTHHLVVDGKDFASIEPAGMQYRFLIQPVPDSMPVRLSRFSVIRRVEDHMLLESGLGHATVRIRNPALMSILGMMVSSQTVASLQELSEPFGVGPDTIAGLILLMKNGRHIEGTSEVDDEGMRLWNTHDLLFHASSRYGRLGGEYGGNFRHIGTIEPAPAVRELPTGERIALPVPVLEDMVDRDPPLQRVVEERQSIYQYGEQPITLNELGEFLYRVARVRWLGKQTVTSSTTGEVSQMEVSSRPIPAGGRGYELELYLTIAQCDGLERGLYHYDPAGHQLTLVRSKDALTEQMLSYASIASPGVQPQILITMAARFRRMMWKYDRLAYAATLKHVGVLIQQMYLAATAMHLAPSALGSGNIETFAAATGNDPIVEGSVGEFILGSSPSGSRAHRPRMLQSEPGS